MTPVSIGIYAGLGAILLLHFIWNMFVRRQRKSVFRFILVLLCFAVALGATLYLKKDITVDNINTVVVATEEAGVGGQVDTVTSAISEAPNTAVSVINFVLGLASPILFYLIFLGLRIVTFVLYLIIGLFIKRNKKSGGVLNFICTILEVALIFVSLLAPVTFYTDLYTQAKEPVAELVSNVTDGAVDLEATEGVDVDSYVNEVANNPVIALYKKIGGDKLNLLMTDFYLAGDTENAVHILDTQDGETVVKGEASGMISVVNSALDMIKSSGSDGEGQGEGEGESAGLALSGAMGDSIIKIADTLPNSKVMSGAIGELIHSLTGAWKEDKAFMGIEPFEMEGSDLLNSFLDEIINVLYNDSDPSKGSEVIIKDIKDMGNIIKVLANTGVFDQGEGEDDIYSKLSGDAVTNVMTALENTNFAGLKDTISNVGKQAVASMFTMEGNEEELEAFSDDIKTYLDAIDPNMTKEEKVEALTANITTALTDCGVELPGVADSVIELYAEDFVEEFLSGEGEFTADDIAAYIASLAGNAPVADGE